MPQKFTVGRHPEANRAGQVFRWAVFMDGKLFEGFRFKDKAEEAAEEYNNESKTEN